MTIADVVKILDGKLMAGDGTSPRAVGAVVANDLNVPLVSSPLSKYDACVRIHDALEAEKRG